jgi:hypothetical protein
MNFFRGDTHEFDIIVTRSGVAVDLTGATLWVTARRTDAPAGTYVFQKGNAGALSGITITNALGGQAHCTIAASDTNTLPDTLPLVLYWDCQLKEASGRVSTIAIGSMTIQEEHTREIA